jgi:transcriptional regulator with XRE-family HTH domain
MNIKIGENLKRLRKAKDITQEELADLSKSLKPKTNIKKPSPYASVFW